MTELEINPILNQGTDDSGEGEEKEGTNDEGEEKEDAEEGT